MLRALIRNCLLLLTLLTCLGLPLGVARADDVADEADVQFSLGAERYQAGDYERALAHFLASNRLAKNRNVNFNIARCYEQLKQFPEAYRYYTRALDGEADASAISRTKEALERVSPLVALLRITSDPPGARIYLDRKDLGERGVAPQRMGLPPGSYRVIAEFDGYEDATSETVQVRVGVERTAALKLKRIVGTVNIPEPPGATVRLDADNTRELCRTPCALQAAPGQHTVILSKEGYRTVRVPVSVERGVASTIRPDFVPESGSLVVNSDERNASIEIDGLTHGFTPAILTVPVGAHRIRVTLRGFRPVERQVLIKTNQQTRLEIELAPADSVEAASRVSEYVEDAPASVSLVGTQELRAMRYPTLTEAVRGVRGTYLSDDRGYQALGFRGFGRPGAYGNRVLITIDGMSINDDWIWSGYVAYDLRTDLDDIDRIEIVRGPGSVLYGTSAFSGVVNLVTRATDAPDGQEVGVSTAAEGVARTRFRINRRFGNDGGFWTSVAVGQSEGRDFFFPEYVDDGPAEVAGHARGVDGSRFATLSGRGTWKALSLAWYLHHQNKQTPTGTFSTLLGDGRTRQSDTRGFLDARLEPKFGIVTWLTRFYANTYHYRGYLARSPEPGEDEGVEEYPYDSSWFGAEQRLMVTPSSVLSITAGGEVQLHPRAKGSGSTEVGGEYFRDERSFQLAAAYGSIDLRPSDSFKISAASRVDYYSTFGTSINPRLAIVASPYPGGNLKIIAGKAFKGPSLYEIYYSAVGQAEGALDLSPENIYSAEIEFSHRFSRNVVATLAGYSNYITDLITLEPLPPDEDGVVNLQYQNTATSVGTLGAEFEIRRDWKEGTMLAASYSFQRSAYLASDSLESLLTLEQSPDYREVPNAPTHLAAVRGAIPLLSRSLMLMTRISLEGQRYDRYDRNDYDEEQLLTENAFLWDFVFSGSEARWGVDYAVGIYNAFDSQARYPLSTEFRQRSIPITGRSLLASLNLKF